MRAASRMPRSARAMLLVASLMLGALFVTPLWSVRLVAPQYPEGIGMLIRLNTIEGMKEHDLRNINSLNHYIGMKAIEPDAIPELRYMPWIAAGLMAAGLLVAALGRRQLLVAWTAAFALLGAAGLYDFWRWSYDYGHNLDVENAIIVVPGMTYQPPLLGTKQLLNFKATSLPSTGGVLAGMSFLLAAGAVVLSYRHGRGGAAALGMAAAIACASDPHIAFGTAMCEECRMVVSDRRFGALVVTEHGRSLTFDSIECMRTHTARPGSPAARDTWVVDAAAPGTLVTLASATIVESDDALRPPMGRAVSYGSGHVR
jgi:copper chaperone NosL